jgi:hypothetical protein
MKWSVRMSFALATAATLFGVSRAPAAKAQEKKPNIVFIMGDDAGWLNIGALALMPNAFDAIGSSFLTIATNERP